MNLPREAQIKAVEFAVTVGIFIRRAIAEGIAAAVAGLAHVTPLRLYALRESPPYGFAATGGKNPLIVIITPIIIVMYEVINKGITRLGMLRFVATKPIMSV
jgi:hypothetical protein